MKKILLSLLAILSLTACSDDINKDSVVKSLKDNGLTISSTHSEKMDPMLKMAAKEYFSAKLSDDKSAYVIICEDKSKCDDLYNTQTEFGIFNYLNQSKTGKVIIFIKQIGEKPSSDITDKLNKSLSSL